MWTRYEKIKKKYTKPSLSKNFGGVVGARMLALVVGIVDDEDGTRSHVPFCGRRRACFVSLRE